MTFKALRKIIDEKKKESDIESKFYDPNHYWKGRRIIPREQWLKIKQDYSLKTALHYFPDGYMSYLFPLSDYIEDPILKEEVERWYSDYENLMEHKRNRTYGHTKCFRCLLSPDREKAAIFLESIK